MIHDILDTKPYEVIRALLATRNFSTKLTTKEKPTAILKAAQASLYKILPQYSSWEDMAEKLPLKVGSSNDLLLFLSREMQNGKHTIPCSSENAYQSWKKLYEYNIAYWRILNHTPRLWVTWESFSYIVNDWRMSKDFDSIGYSDKLVAWFMEDTEKLYGVQLRYKEEDINSALAHKKVMDWQRGQFNYSKPVDLSDFDAVKIWNEQEEAR